MKNTFGNNFSVTLFGESHGSGIGAVIDGIAPGIKIDEEYRLMINNPNNLVGTNLMLVSLDNEEQPVADDQEEIEME